jgi:hypothetical protein
MILDAQQSKRTIVGRVLLNELKSRFEKKRESHCSIYLLPILLCATSRTSEAKDGSQNTKLHRPLMDMDMLEKS